MIQAFYKTKPEQDTPHRQLSGVHDDDDWKVRLVAGTKWGRDDAQELSVTPAPSFEEAKRVFDQLFEQLQSDGWRAYTPWEIW